MNTMRDLGEKKFLADLLPTLTPNTKFVNGFGHDASIIDIGIPNIDLVMKIDRAAKPIAAINGWCNYQLWGRLAVTANCSDILTVGGSLEAFMISLSLPGDTDAQIAREIIEGAEKSCRLRGISFIGGDTKEAESANVVGSVIGTVPKGRHFDRKMGRKNDLLVLAGSLGGVQGAYWICSKESRSLPDAIKYLSEPNAMWSEAQAMAELSVVRSACDLSDGLAESALNVAGKGLGVRLDFDSLPFHKFARRSAYDRNIDILPYAFGVGDWGILYAVDLAARSDIKSLRDSGLELSVIGEIVSKPGIHLKRQGLYSIHAEPHEHFRQRMEDQGSYLVSIHKQGVFSLNVNGLRMQ